MKELVFYLPILPKEEDWLEQVKHLSAIARVEYQAENHLLTIKYDPTSATKDEVVSHIQKIVPQLVEQKIEDYAVEEIGCASCALTIETGLNKIDGIHEVIINPVTQKVRVFSDASVTKEEVEEKLSSLGYPVVKKEVPVTKEESPSSKKKEDTSHCATTSKAKKSSFHLVTMGILAAISFYISMAPMLHLPIFSVLDLTTHPEITSIVLLLLSLPVLYFARKIYNVGFTALFHFSPNMETLIALGTSISWVYSVYETVQIFLHHSYHGLYYDSVALILTFVLIGHTIEHRTTDSAKDTLKDVSSMIPKVVHKIMDNHTYEDLPADQLQVGDEIQVRSGETIPFDGVILEGTSDVQESMLNGESLPKTKTVGDKVYAGTISTVGTINVKIEKATNDNMLYQISNLVEKAQQDKLPIHKLVDKISKVFVPLVMILAVVTFLFWKFYAKDSIDFSLNMLVSVLIIACPCALGLATPISTMISMKNLAQKGILLKKSSLLEEISHIDTVVFDKTGTLTTGTLAVEDVILMDEKEDQGNFLAMVGSVEQSSEHPIAKAIVEEVKKEQLSFVGTKEMNTYPGLGTAATIDGAVISIGNQALMKEKGVEIPQAALQKVEAFENEGKTVIYCAKDTTFLGMITLSDTLRPESKKVVQALQAMDKKVVILTGDNERNAKAIAQKLGVTEVIANVLPQNKQNEIQKLMNAGRKVIMVGDGINDAPSIATATIGISMNSGTNLAIDASDIILINDALTSIPELFFIGKKTLFNIKENLFWALVYNVISIPIAMGIPYFFGGPLVNPVISSIAMSASSIIIVLNALRLKHLHFKD